MSPDEVAEAIQSASAKGHEYFQVEVFRRRLPRNWDRVKVAAKLWGRCIRELESAHPPPFGEAGRYLVDVRVSDAERSLRRTSPLPGVGEKP